MVRSDTAPDALLDTRPVWAEVDLAALGRNYKRVRGLLSPAVGVIASVKANAYGHGIVPIARELAMLGVDALATASFQDAVAMREAGVQTQILLFGSALPEAAPAILEHDLIPTVYDLEGARAFSASAQRPCGVYVKVDAGLGRLGVPLEAALEFVKSVDLLPKLRVDGIYTHLPFGDEQGRRWAEEGIRAFDNLVQRLRDEGISVAVTQARSSPGVLLGLPDNCSAVCPGHLLLGVPHPAADLSGRWLFEPVFRALKTRLIHVASRRNRTSIGVGGQYDIHAGSTTGVVPFGRVDGHRRVESRQAEMMIGSRRAPVIGLSLEHSTLDLSAAIEPQVGDEVVVFGQGDCDAITLEEAATWAGGTALDLLMSINRRVTYRYFRDETAVASFVPEGKQETNAQPG